MNVKPWEVHPGLTEDRLLSIAMIMSRARKKALDRYDPADGDGPWSLECTVYERTMNSLAREAKDLPWLRCIRRNLYFLLLVGGVPIRFKRQNFEKAETMDIRLFDTEIMAHQLAFDYDESGWFWRLFIETDENRDILRLVLAQITEAGSTKNAFTIPLTGSVSLASPVKTTRREAAQVERIQLGVKKSSDKKVVEYGNNQQ